MNKAFWLTAGFDLLVHCFAIEYINTHTETDTSTNIFQMVLTDGVRLSVFQLLALVPIQIWWYFIWNFNKRKTLHLIPKCVLKSVVRFLLLVLLRSALLCSAPFTNRMLIEWCLEQIVCLWLYSRKWTMQQRRSILRKAKRLLLDTDTDT